MWPVLAPIERVARINRIKGDIAAVHDVLLEITPQSNYVRKEESRHSNTNNALPDKVD